MRGDVSRQTFRSDMHYRSVRQQQGRVQLDADWNEQVDLQAYLDRTVTADLVGRSGAPSGNAGMAITDAAGAPLLPGVTAAELHLSAGHYYVDGILCENDAWVPLTAQPDLPGVGLDKPDPGEYIAFLDVWFEHLTALEEPALREVALGGPDTTTRSRTVWQVRLRAAAEPVPDGAGKRKARMRASTVSPGAASAGPCVISPDAPYRRLENQLYRVEVFAPTSAGAPTFLWSRENGSVVAAVTDLDGTAVTLAAPGRDDRLGFHKDDWVELTDLGRVRRGEPGYLGTIAVVDAAGTGLNVTWAAGPPPPTESDVPDHPVLRRWDSPDGPQPLIPATGTTIALEGGIQVEFDAAGDYRTGDYWLIPARTASLESIPGAVDLAGDIEWPQASFKLPDGVEHHYADIAHLTLSAGRWTVDDDRRIFDPLTDRLEVTAAGGDGQESRPGVTLDEPLRVAVTRNLLPVKGLKVRYSTVAGGLLAGSGPQVDVDTGADGVATCTWLLDERGSRTQAVIARLLDASGTPTGPVLAFTASLSRADGVAFDPGTCAALAEATTVQEAVSRLADVPTLVLLDGTGQIAAANAVLPAPATVLVRRCGAPVPGATVRFTSTQGQVGPVGGAMAAPFADITTDAAGLAACTWQLGRDRPLQTLTASLLAPDLSPDLRALPLTVVAGVVPDILTVQGVESPAGTALPDGAIVAADALAADGVILVLDGAPTAAVDVGRTLTVTLDLPYPISQADRDLWPVGIVGTMPLDLDGTVAVNGPSLRWSPSAEASGLLAALIAGAGRDRVRCRVQLAASVLGDGAAGFTRWFWLVERLSHLVLVPHKNGRLRLPSTQSAIALSVPRDAMRAGLPLGITVLDVAPDTDRAKQFARTIFNKRTAPRRRLRLVVDARDTAAGAAVRDALAGLGVQVELLDAADPAAEAQTRLGAGETIDGVLTDAASADVVRQIAGFLEPVQL